MPFDASGFPEDGATPVEPREPLWLRYSIAVLLILAVMAIPAWGLWRIAHPAIWQL
jgi:hypothetical protein